MEECLTILGLLDFECSRHIDRGLLPVSLLNSRATGRSNRARTLPITSDKRNQCSQVSAGPPIQPSASNHGTVLLLSCSACNFGQHPAAPRGVTVCRRLLSAAG